MSDESSLHVVWEIKQSWLQATLECSDSFGWLDVDWQAVPCWYKPQKLKNASAMLRTRMSRRNGWMKTWNIKFSYSKYDTIIDVINYNKAVVWYISSEDFITACIKAIHILIPCIFVFLWMDENMKYPKSSIILKYDTIIDVINYNKAAVWYISSEDIIWLSAAAWINTTSVLSAGQQTLSASFQKKIPRLVGRLGSGPCLVCRLDSGPCLVCRLDSGPCLVCRIRSGVRVNASFQKNECLVGRLESGPRLVDKRADVVPTDRANVVFTHACQQHG